MSRNKAIAEGIQALIQHAIKGLKADVGRVKGLAKSVDVDSKVAKSLSPEDVSAAEVISKRLEKDPRQFKKGIVDITQTGVNEKVSNLSDTLTKSYINEGKFTDKMRSKLKPLMSDLEINKIEGEGIDFWKEKKLKKTLSDKMKFHRMNEINAELYADVSTMYGDKIKLVDIELNNIKGDPLAVSTEKAKRLFNKRAAAKKLMIGDEKPITGSLKALWNKSIPTLKTKLNHLKQLSDEKGWTEVSDRVTATHKFMESSDGLNTRTNNWYKSTSKMWGKYDDETQRKMMQLYDSENIAKVPMGKTGILAAGEIEVDDALRRSLGLEMEHAEVINQTKNMFRVTQKLTSEYDNGIYSGSFNRTDKIFGDIDDLPKHELIYREDKFDSELIGDLGPDYRPLRPTDEYKATWDEALGLNPHDADYHFDSQPKIWKSRKEGSDLSKDVYKQKVMSETLDDYRKSYLNSMIKKMGNRHLDRLEGDFSVFAPLRGGAEAYKHFPVLKDLREHWQDIHKFKPERPESFVGDLYSLASDVTKTVLLMPPRLALFNLGQALTNGITKDPISLIKSQLGGGGLLMDAVFSKGNMKEAYRRNMKRETDPVRKFVKEKYFKEFYPNVNASIIDFEGEGMKGSFRSVLNMATMMYQTSDLFTRFVSLDACMGTLEKSIQKHNRFRGSHPDEFFKRVSKDLRFEAFGDMHIEKQEMRNALMGIASNRNLGIEELGYKYAKNSTELEIYNYSKYGRPAVIDKAKNNKLTADALAFVSWPMYYTNVINGAVKAAGKGDYRPLGYLATLGAGWYFGMSELSDVDNETIAGMAKYGMYRTPVISPVMGLVQMPTRAMSGLVTPAIHLMTLPAAALAAKANDDMTRERDFFDWQYLNVKKGLKNSPIISKGSAAVEYLENTLELMDLSR